jgi:uncharacterized protein (DUF305 family)
MRIYLSSSATAILMLFISGCSTIATPMNADGSGTMAGMDHSKMNMESNTDLNAMFIDSMIEHHQGAVAMAELAIEQAEHEEVRTLAEAILTAQEAEIEQMQGWLQEWYGVSQ